MSENTINIGDMVKHRYNTSEEQAKTIGIVVDISKAAWSKGLLIYFVDWLNSPYPMKASGYRFDDLERT
ncbi:MAG: hypothetical protein RIR47_52 [Bacteroidota bacterium]|jgi:hypothetical protein